MADEADLANETAALLNRAALLRQQSGRESTVLSNGICARCEEEIEPGRLKADPFAKYCSYCAQEIEDEAARNKRRGP